MHWSQIWRSYEFSPKHLTHSFHRKQHYQLTIINILIKNKSGILGDKVAISRWKNIDFLGHFWRINLTLKNMLWRSGCNWPSIGWRIARVWRITRTRFQCIQHGAYLRHQWLVVILFLFSALVLLTAVMTRKCYAYS